LFILERIRAVCRIEDGAEDEIFTAETRRSIGRLGRFARGSLETQLTNVEPDLFFLRASAFEDLICHFPYVNACNLGARHLGADYAAFAKTKVARLQ
jgi:hypothetical protein